VGVENFCSVHVSLVPQLGVVGEQKTKPTQHSVRTVRGLGLSPDVIVCRSSDPLTAGTKRKISMYCHVSPASVLGCHDVTNIYHVPLLLQKQGLMQVLCRRLSLPVPPIADARLDAWGKFADHVDHVRQNAGMLGVGWCIVVVVVVVVVLPCPSLFSTRRSACGNCGGGQVHRYGR
jgi:CTP synthase